jgi:ATP-dependent protease ClpP protease subunit
MTKSKDEIEKILSNGFDLRKRRIYFGGNVDSEDAEVEASFSWSNVEQTVRLIHSLSDNSQKPIELHMSSGGGSFHQALRLYDTIQQCPCQIKFYGSGDISSSASIIMAACDERYLDRHTRVMLHNGSGGISADDNQTDMQIKSDENARLEDVMCQILEDNSRLNKEYWKTVLVRDVILSAEECITIGITDKITEYKKRGNLRRSRIANLAKKVDDEKMQALLDSINKRIYLPAYVNVTISAPKEQRDKDIYVDDTPVTDEEAQALLSDQHSEEPQSLAPEKDPH